MPVSYTHLDVYKRQQKDRLAEVLYNLTESITIGASLLHPFLPETAEKIVAQLSTSLRDFDELNQFGLYPDGTKVTDAPEILFARIDAKEIQPKVDAIQAKQKEEYEKEQKALNGGESADEAVIDIDPKEEITFDDFTKMQFQVGEILSCEAVAKSKKPVSYTHLPQQAGSPLSRLMEQT